MKFLQTMVVAVLTACMWLLMVPDAPAQASDRFYGWVTWEIPDGGTGQNVKYPQPFVGVGEIGALECGVTYQTDLYDGPKKDVEAMWADGLLQHGEDYPYVKKWYFTTGDCPVMRKFQVDTYLNPTTKLAKKAAGYDNDGKLKWGEDRRHYGHSRYQTVPVAGFVTWTVEQWCAAINDATTGKGLGSVWSGSHVGKLAKGSRLTVAWQIHGSWKKHPQTFFARGVK